MSVPMAKKTTEKIQLADFPEEIDEISGVRLYGNLSYETQMAVLSQYLHTHEANGEREEIVSAVREFLARKQAKGKEAYFANYGEMPFGDITKRYTKFNYTILY